MSFNPEKTDLVKLDFKNLKFECIIALDGDLPTKKTIDTLGKVPILAADGSAISLMKRSIIADYIIGDLDTFRSNPLSKNFEIEKQIYLPSQELNDFEKTLRFAMKLGYRNILIIGFHGGELEHTLNNWSVLRKYQKKLNLCLLDGRRYGIPLTQSCNFTCQKNELISLIPQPIVKLTTKNLKWNLKNETLELGVREGARNIATSDNVTLTIHSGELLLFIDARLPFCPEFS